MIDLNGVGVHQWNVTVRDIIPILYVRRSNCASKTLADAPAVHANGKYNIRARHPRDQSGGHHPVPSNPRPRWCP